MIDTTLIDKIREMANKEKKINEFKKRLRTKGKVVSKGTTKKGNIILTVKKDEDELKFTILKSHKDSYALAERLSIGRCVSVQGIPKLRMIICTRLKLLEKGIADGKQMKLVVN